MTTKTRLDDERYVTARGHVLRIHYDPQGGCEIYVNSHEDGLLLGLGRTRNAALRPAVATLEALLAVLQGPPPDQAARLVVDQVTQPITIHPSVFSPKGE